jgi:ATP-dependent helicase HrpB
VRSGPDDSASLPVRAVAGQVLESVRACGRLVLTAETGSGKTTQVPQILLEGGVEGQVLVLEPRRLAARMVARRVATEMGTRPGERVGWRTRFDAAWSAATRIGFVTEGVFLRMLVDDPQLRGVGAVVVDEFHERSLQGDLAVAGVCRLQARRPDLKLLIMSATLDADRLAERLGARRVHAAGRQHPVTVRHSTPGRDVCETAALQAARLAEEMGGDVLVFMPGAREIERTLAAARQLGLDRDLVWRRLHGSMPPAEQDLVLEPAARPRVVVATNVAQTSVTVPGVRGVVDAGTARVHRADPRRGLDALRLEPISRAAADQRAGRAGRVAPGVCVRLWSEQDHARRAEFDQPEIARVELSDAALQVAACTGSVHDFPWLDPPEPHAWTRAVETLQRLGAVDARGAITEAGAAMARVPAAPRLAAALRAAAAGGCLVRASRWVAVAMERDFVRGGDRGAMLACLEHGDEPGDLVVRERILQRLAEGRSLPRGLQIVEEAAREALRASDRLARALPRSGGDTAGVSTERVALAMLHGFADGVAWRPDPQRPHLLAAGRRKAVLDRDSVVHAGGFVLCLQADENPADPDTQILSMAEPLLESWVRAALPDAFEVVERLAWNPPSRAVERLEEVLFAGVPVDRTARPPRLQDHPEAERLLAERVREGEVILRGWDESVTQWIERVRCVAGWFPEQRLLTYEADDLELIRLELCSGLHRASQVEDLPCLEAVRGVLDPVSRAFVERMAPAHLALPEGPRPMRLHYEVGKPPRGAARIQHLYGLERTPTVAGGRVPVTLEILGPNMRPLQVTSDLANFWKTLYPSLRNELRRRYPRHAWR